MKANPYLKLKLRFLEAGLRQVDVAGHMGITQQALSCKLNCKAGWTVKEMYLIADILHIKDPAELLSLFPKTG